MSIFPNSFLSDFLHIPRRESDVQVILTLNHYPRGPENSIYVDIYIQIISPSCIYPGCDAGTAQPPPGSKESVSAYSPSGPYYCLLTPVSQKGVLYFFYFE